MKPQAANDAAKMRIAAAQLRHHARATNRPDYIAKFERAAAELERKAEEAERGESDSPVRRIDSWRPTPLKLHETENGRGYGC